jgi:hypothetical protein
LPQISLYKARYSTNCEHLPFLLDLHIHGTPFVEALFLWLARRRLLYRKKVAIFFLYRFYIGKIKPEVESTTADIRQKLGFDDQPGEIHNDC